jgi:glutathionyl-hydroquinone reductase
VAGAFVRQQAAFRGDELDRFEFLAEAYREADPEYDGRISVPVLWDKETETIVSNESADIVRMLDEWVTPASTPRSCARRSRSSTSGSTATCRTASTARASRARTHFRCNDRRLVDHPGLWGCARELYQRPGIADTIAMDQIRAHYYTTHDSLNP